MIACKHFVWIHVMKTGGQWFRRQVLPAIPKGWNVTDINQHVSLREARARGHRAPSWACVRNPWDWYRSMHTFMLQHWTDKTGAYAQPRHVQAPNAQAWADHFQRGERFPQTLRAMLRGDLMAPYSKHFREMTTDGSGREVDHIVRFEHLRPEVMGVLQRLCGPLPAPLQAAVQRSRPENTSRHTQLKAYYNPQLVQLVAEADRELIERFGYRPPDCAKT